MAHGLLVLFLSMKRVHLFPLVMGTLSLSFFSLFSIGTGSVGCGVKVETPNQIDQYLQGQWVAERLTSDGTRVVLGFEMTDQGVRLVGVNALTQTGQMSELSRGTYSFRSNNNILFDFESINDFQAVYSFIDATHTRMTVGSDTYTKASSDGGGGPVVGGQIRIGDALGDLSVGVGALSLSDSSNSSESPESIAPPAPQVTPDVIVRMRDGSVRRVMIQPQVPAAAALSISDSTSIVSQLNQQQAHNRAIEESVYESVEALKADPDVLSVTPNIMLQTQSISAPTDSLFSDQWNLRLLNVLDAWAQLGDASAGRDVVVAVIDTGIVTTPRPADLGNRVLYDYGYDFVDDQYWSSRENCNSAPTTPAWRDFDLDGNGPDSDPTDPGQAEFHGTHVTGIIAAGLDNGGIVGIAGPASRVKILPIRSMGKCGGGTLFNNAEAIKYAAKILPNMGDCVYTMTQDQNTHTITYTPPSSCTPETVRNPTAYSLRPRADIINLSLGQFMRTDDYNNVLGDAIRRAKQAGVLVIAAAGNTQGGGKGPGWCPNPTTGVLERNASCNFYPASDRENVLSVGAVYPNLSFATDYSNYSSQTVQPHYLVAPGGSNNDGVNSITRVDDPDGSGGYKELIGTSQAAPHVAGVAAMMMSVAPGPTRPAPDMIITMLENSAIPMTTSTTTPYWDDRFGRGLLNPVGAIVAAKGGSATGIPRLSLSASQLVFGYTGTSATVLATSSNGAPLSSINATATTANGRAWLAVTSSSVSTPARLNITVNRTGLADGDYAGTITVNSSAGPQTINVSMRISSTQTTGDSLTNLRDAIERLTGTGSQTNSEDIGTVIVSLIDPLTDEEVFYTTTDFTADYKFLMGVQPGRYYLKAVADLNNNRQIDVGEPVFAYPNIASPQILDIPATYSNTRLILNQ